jgi:hypothetical protein
VIRAHGATGNYPDFKWFCQADWEARYRFRQVIVAEQAINPLEPFLGIVRYPDFCYESPGPGETEEVIIWVKPVETLLRFTQKITDGFMGTAPSTSILEGGPYRASQLSPPGGRLFSLKFSVDFLNSTDYLVLEHIQG